MSSTERSATREYPILFNGEMVRAILAGHKTQTRRPIKPQLPGDARDFWLMGDYSWNFKANLEGREVMYMGLECPFGHAGARLWVRETWAPVWPGDAEVPLCECKIEYRADLPDGCADYPGQWPADEARGNAEALKWRPSIHMPRWASRITLGVTGVRVQRLQDISEDDAEAEGVEIGGDGQVRTQWNYFRDAFACAWDSIYAERSYGWDANPWVWVIEFRMVAPGGSLGRGSDAIQ